MALVGLPTPRIATPVIGDTERVAAAIEFAGDIGVTLLPWQIEVLDRSLRTIDGRYVHRTVLCICARQMGKTVVAGVRALSELCLFGSKLVVMAAQSRDIALESFRNCVDIARDADMPIERIRYATGSEEMILDLDGHPRLKVVSSTSGGGRGLSPDLVIWDELASMRTLDSYAALEKSRRAHRNSQMFAITTEGDAQSVVLTMLQDQGRTAAAMGDSSGIAYMEWSAAPDLAPDNRIGWAQSNPALGHLIDEDTIAQELRTDPPEVFERETLCRRTAARTAWLPAGTWELCEDASATVPDGAAVVFALDATPDLAHVSITAAYERPDGRAHVELIEVHHDTRTAQRRLRELVERWNPAHVAVVAKGPVESVAKRAGAPVLAVGATDLARAARSFYEAVTASRVVHPPGAVLAAHLAAAEMAQPGLFATSSTHVETDAAVAAVLALWALDVQPALVTPTWVAF